MHLTTGTRLGPYEVTGEIGAGGMGEVYKARDTRLGRDVAIKVLPEAFATDPDRRARFERETQAVASLSHPNIVALFDTGSEAAGAGSPVIFAVTELLVGQTLRERLTDASGRTVALPARKALDIAVQIARGLAAAHDKGLVHRDLKPENVFVLSDGQVKILDFGLARLVPGTATGTASETVAAITDPGTAMGTVGYMAPEQVRGETVDARTDLFALGAVLYEMLSGHRAFQRETNAETMTAILREDPPEVGRDGSDVPAGLARLILRCLEKNPAERFQSARDLAFHLDAFTLGSTSGTGAMSTLPEAPAAGRRPPIAAAALLVAGVLVGLSGGWMMFRPPATVPARVEVQTFSGTAEGPAISPDGQLIAYSSSQGDVRQIWIKQVNGGGETARTSGPLDYLPRFSPDGTQLLFIREEDGRTDLFRVPVLGGEPRRILGDVSVADWSPDGTHIAVASRVNGALSSIGIVRADGTQPQPLEQLDDWDVFSLAWSPDGRLLAGMVNPLTGTAGTRIRLTPVNREPGGFLDDPASFEVVSTVSWSKSSRELVYAAQQPGTASSRVVAHDVASDQVRTLFWTLGTPSVVDVSEAGSLVYDAVAVTQSLREASLGDAGTTRWLTRGSSVDRQPVFSPDSEWVLFSSTRSGNRDLWTISRTSGTVRRLTDDAAADWDPAYSPDGRTVLWSSDRGGHYEIWMAAADGTGARQVSQDGVDAENPTMTPGGEWIVYASGHPEKRGLWKLRPDGTDATLIAVGSKTLPELSPDGRYVAYLDNAGPGSRPLEVLRLETGDVVFRTEVPRNGSPDVNFGRVRWMPDGRQLAFVARDTDGRDGIFVQSFAPGVDTRGTRRRLAGFFADVSSESFGIAPDGSAVVISSLGRTSDVLVASELLGLGRPGGSR